MKEIKEGMNRGIKEWKERKWTFFLQWEITKVLSLSLTFIYIVKAITYFNKTVATLYLLLALNGPLKSYFCFNQVNKVVISFLHGPLGFSISCFCIKLDWTAKLMCFYHSAKNKHRLFYRRMGYLRFSYASCFWR